MKLHWIIRKRMTTAIANNDHISNPFLIKLYLYNVSRINIDTYMNILNLYNWDEDYKNEKKNLNKNYYNNPQFFLYKYFHYLNEYNSGKKNKLIQLLTFLYSKNLREYYDKKNNFYNSFVHINNFFFTQFGYIQRKTDISYFGIIEQKERKKKKDENYNKVKPNETNTIRYKYSLYTDIFLYALDFYIYHLSKNFNFLNIEQLNILAEIFANINISPNNHNLCVNEFKNYNDGKEMFEISFSKKAVNSEKNEYEENYLNDIEQKATHTYKNDSNLYEININNKICLFYVHISKSIIRQTYSYIVRNCREDSEKQLKDLISNNIYNCKNILDCLLNKHKKNTDEQFAQYIILKKKYNKKNFNINVLKKYLNSIKYLNIINIKKDFYIICYLYFSSYLFNKSIYYSSLIFYLLQKYNLQYTYIFNILLIKFTLFFLNKKTFSDYNDKVICDSINKYIDAILVLKIKEGKKNESNMNELDNNLFTFIHEKKTNDKSDPYIDIYKREYKDNLNIYKYIHKNSYKNGNTNFLTYFEYSVLCLFKYFYYNIEWCKKKKKYISAHNKEIHDTENNFSKKNKIFICKKYKKFNSCLPENLLSNIILLSIYVQNCLPLLFSYMQNMRKINKVKLCKNLKKKKNPCKIYHTIKENYNHPHINKEKKKNYLNNLLPTKNETHNIFVYKKYMKENIRETIPFYKFLFHIYNIFRDLVILNNEESYVKRDEENIEYNNSLRKEKKNEEEYNMYCNIKKNKKNKIQTSITHYYISSNLKRINYNKKLYNEKNILTFFCDIYFDNNIIEVDGPKHFFIYYSINNNEKNYFTSFIKKNKEIFYYNYIFPLFFNQNINTLNLDNNCDRKIYHIYNDKSIKKNFFLYIYGYNIKHINYDNKNITTYKYLYELLFKTNSQLHATSFGIV
ncbi:conserved Plasmodium protein, unknown function [Plasmodium berghei]|uniref:Uncharacterized protein n=2 Tax=Plasmodium berghei TaxID=5821 RepID=A0A509ARF5_PLABA|nr:conserved Plasmodium protein, unknown function [Plasmodium berghei ANKA]CXJ03097.1 conserved Plasmodium protein, unknown function [Plasmodium berghei]SCL98415.1 conserved Plasmodium protein, unknown function [Plasmodium berghei]SCM16826.1 conserved Plasmodium protein, unknown function [Plasmodium berghei]SCM18624.1 conserved Plasmodium protein, unknown function [Plasmodium berghei]SCN28059.1 conserved Plasmodium protein, unknown function [Plasmodium berghei]|eukprot:XP_034423710.1 conserved Plasmodium protein, unknown function [Plasmodium berghei ANKA]